MGNLCGRVTITDENFHEKTEEALQKAQQSLDETEHNLKESTRFFLDAYKRASTDPSLRNDVKIYWDDMQRYRGERTIYMKQVQLVKRAQRAKEQKRKNKEFAKDLRAVNDYLHPRSLLPGRRDDPETTIRQIEQDSERLADFADDVDPSAIQLAEPTSISDPLDIDADNGGMDPAWKQFFEAQTGVVVSPIPISATTTTTETTGPAPPPPIPKSAVHQHLEKSGLSKLVLLA
jgi:hypothetical protein